MQVRNVAFHILHIYLHLMYDTWFSKKSAFLLQYKCNLISKLKRGYLLYH